MDAAEVEDLSEPLPQDLVFVDLETTGGSAAHDRITEIGLVRLKDGVVVDEWSSLVNPERPIPAYIEAFTGISNEMVADAPLFAEIAALALGKLQSAVFVAHNARFDYSFLRSEFQRAGRSFSAKVLCTVKLSRRLFPQFIRHNLDAVMERNGIVCDARHRALGDAKVIRDFWLKVRREVPPQQLADALRGLLGAYKLPAHLPPDFADDLPEGPGVYRFLDEAGTVLYVGRSNSLRARVCGHFSAEPGQSKDRRLSDKVRRVEWVESAGELGALLLEMQWIKVQKPVFNRRGKSAAQPHTLRAGARGTRSAGPPVEAVAIECLDLTDLTECFGVFHSEKDARKALADIARAHQLCLKVLGLEDAAPGSAVGAGSCVALQLGKCKGACTGKEPILLHNMRLQLALSSLKLKAWPFPGRVALRERESRYGGFGGARAGEFHVVEHWAYLGTARSEEELAALRVKEGDGSFDADAYRILVRYFSTHPKLDWHDLSQTASTSTSTNAPQAAYNIAREFNLDD
jgi:DNA polymerase-3 subunit epsilon